MGTNYYWSSNPCEACGVSKKKLHVGKSSAGWVFALRVHHDEGIHSYGDWAERFPHGIINDEYGRPVSTEEMIKVITERSWKSEVEHSDSFLRQNYAIPGPHGLLRSDPSRLPSVTTGEGTWDLHDNEFC